MYLNFDYTYPSLIFIKTNTKNIEFEDSSKARLTVPIDVQSIEIFFEYEYDSNSSRRTRQFCRNIIVKKLFCIDVFQRNHKNIEFIIGNVDNNELDFENEISNTNADFTVDNTSVVDQKELSIKIIEWHSECFLLDVHDLECQLSLVNNYLDALNDQKNYLVDYFHGLTDLTLGCKRWYSYKDNLPTEIVVKFKWEFCRRLGYYTLTINPCYNYDKYLKYFTKCHVKRNLNLDSIRNNNLLSHCLNFENCKNAQLSFDNPIEFTFGKIKPFSSTQIEVILEISSNFYEDLFFSIEMVDIDDYVHWIGQLKFNGILPALGHALLKCYFIPQRLFEESKVLCSNLYCKILLESTDRKIVLWKK